MVPPEKIILDCGEAFRALQVYLNNPELPLLDPDALVQQLVDLVSSLDDFDNRLANAVLYNSMAEGLFDVEFMNPALEQKLVNAIVHLGTTIKNKLVEIHAYRHGHCPYHFEEFVDDRSLLLYFQPRAPTTPVRRGTAGHSDR